MKPGALRLRRAHLPPTKRTAGKLPAVRFASVLTETSVFMPPVSWGSGLTSVLRNPVQLRVQRQKLFLVQIDACGSQKAGETDHRKAAHHLHHAAV